MGPSKAGADKVTVGDSDFKAGQSVMAPWGRGPLFPLDPRFLTPCIHSKDIAHNTKKSMFTGVFTEWKRTSVAWEKTKVFAGRCR